MLLVFVPDDVMSIFSHGAIAFLTAGTFKPYLNEQVFLNIMLVILIVNAILHFRKM